jgi:hypothetical protein
MSSNSPSFKRSPNVLFQEIEGQAMLLNIQTERYYSLDEVGTRIWQILEEGDLNVLISRLRTEFEVDEAILRADLEKLFSELEAAGLVSRN